MTRTGLLFGSFNPVHIGHIALAGYMKEFAGMDEIWFIVSPQNPLKSPRQLAPPKARLEMVRLATREYPSFVTSDIEFGMPVPSYTVNTLEKIGTIYPGRDFYIIIGTDNLESIRLWKGSSTLLNDYKFLIYPRLKGSLFDMVRGSDDIGTGFTGFECGKKTGEGTLHGGGISGFKNAKLTDAPIIGVSSTFIRESITAGKDMRAFLPPRVHDYLQKNSIYL